VVGVELLRDAATAFDRFEQARGGALCLSGYWERVEAGVSQAFRVTLRVGFAGVGAASSESAAGSGWLRACGC